MTRRAATIVGVLAIGALLGACGSSSRTARSATAATSSAEGTTALRGGRAAGPSTITKREAIALGQAINLRTSDVPGFRVSSGKEHETATEARLEHELLRCVGLQGSKGQIAQVSSREFERTTSTQDESVQSGVSVQQTPALAARELDAIRSPAVRTCFARYLDQLFASHKYHGATVSPVSVAYGTPPATGAAGSFALRINTKITAPRVAIPIYFDILGFVVGPAEVTLVTDGLPQPVPAATEERLFSLLLGRARAHPT